MEREFAFINVSSAVADRPQRYSSVYSGTKAYCSNVMKVLGL
jgi:short-subunit dehydrogenase